jgi:ABC-type transport system involved in Fe-S cluster assembly fused permease/ATPase subunit
MLFVARQDSKTEMEIIASLQEIAINRTTIMIAHRLSTGKRT